MNQNMNQGIVCVRMDGDKLINAYGQTPNELIGYTAKAYEEALSIAEEYRKILVDNHLLEEEKTVEEKLGDINTKMDTILTMMAGFDERLIKIEGVERGYQQNHPDGSKDNRTRPKQT